MAVSDRDPSTVTNDLIRLLEDRGTGDYIGENISQLEHCLQCAHFSLQAGIHVFISIGSILTNLQQRK